MQGGQSKEASCIAFIFIFDFAKRMFPIIVRRHAQIAMLYHDGMIYHTFALF